MQLVIGLQVLINNLISIKMFKFLNRFKNRNIIIHNHLFKNAGTTIDWALTRNFRNTFVDHRDDDQMMLGANYLGPYIKNNPKIKALSSHHLHFPLPKIKGINFFTIMMFRHPIERVSSVYKFEKKQVDSDTLGAKYARNHSFREYVEWRMRDDVPPTIRNFHIFKIQSPTVSWKNEIASNCLVQSKKQVEKNSLIGFIENFDESMVLFENTLLKYFPNINLSYLKQNIGQKNKNSIENRIERIRKEIGKKTFELLLENNDLDMHLYEYAKRFFKNRLLQINNFENHMADFRNRCSLINNQSI